jgi:hypothetical protein
MKRAVAQRRRRQKGPKKSDWIGESAFSQLPGQVRLYVKESLHVSGTVVRAAQRGSQQDAWRVS